MEKVRIVIVDENESNRRGMSEMLAPFQDVDVMATTNFPQALERNADFWRSCDVALIDAGDVEDEDEMPGVAVVEHIKRQSAATKAVVVTSYFTNDPLRFRMREAGADAMVNRTQVTRTAHALHSLVLRPTDPGLPPVEDWESLGNLGVHEDTRVNEALRRLTEVLHEEGLELKDFRANIRDNHLARKLGDVKRTRLERIKAIVAHELRLLGARGASSRGNIWQIRKFIDRFTRVEGN